MSVDVEKNLIDVKDAPDISGLTFRHFRGQEDFPEMLRVIMACREVDGDEHTETLEEMTRNYETLTHCDPYTDMIFAEINGEVIGYGRCTWWQEDEAPRKRLHTGFGWVVPEWRRRGIGSAMLRYQEDHVRQMTAEERQNDDAPNLYEAWSSETEVAKTALLKGEGYQPVTYGATMHRPITGDLPVHPLPDGFEVRPVKEEHLRAIWEADLEAFRDHWGFADPPDHEVAFQEFLNFPYRDESLWKVAWSIADNEVAGMVRSFINPAENEEYQRKRGYTEFISVRRPYRRQGLAKALIVMSMQVLKDRGMEEAAHGVHTENRTGAFQLYQSLGYRVFKEFTTWRKPMD